VGMTGMARILTGIEVTTFSCSDFHPCGLMVFDIITVRKFEKAPIF
jgi:hypothetical protein